MKIVYTCVVSVLCFECVLRNGDDVGMVLYANVVGEFLVLCRFYVEICDGNDDENDVGMILF